MSYLYWNQMTFFNPEAMLTTLKHLDFDPVGRHHPSSSCLCSIWDNSLFAISYCLFAISYSLFPIRHFLFAIFYSLFPIRYFLFAISYSLLPTSIRYFLFAIQNGCHLHRVFPEASALTKTLAGMLLQQLPSTLRQECWCNICCEHFSHDIIHK